MRKYENVDIVSSLGAVVELNTEHYKSDFKYDIEMFKEAAKNPDGENNRLLWLSRQSGTYCHLESDVYIKDTAAFNYWKGCADILGSQSSFPTVIVTDRVLAFAVNVTGIENGRIKGDLYELDYRNHIRHIDKNALPLHTVTATYKDGTTVTLPHKEHDAMRERLYLRHGALQTLIKHPEDTGALQDILKQAREQRDKEARPAMFKLRVQNPKQPGISKQGKQQQQPTIKQQLEANKKQLAADRAAAPEKTAAKTATKNKNTGLGD